MCSNVKSIPEYPERMYHFVPDESYHCSHSETLSREKHWLHICTQMLHSGHPHGPLNTQQLLFASSSLDRSKLVEVMDHRVIYDANARSVIMATG